MSVQAGLPPAGQAATPRRRLARWRAPVELGGVGLVAGQGATFAVVMAAGGRPAPEAVDGPAAVVAALVLVGVVWAVARKGANPLTAATMGVRRTAFWPPLGWSLAINGRRQRGRGLFTWSSRAPAPRSRPRPSAGARARRPRCCWSRESCRASPRTRSTTAVVAVTTAVPPGVVAAALLAPVIAVAICWGSRASAPLKTSRRSARRSGSDWQATAGFWLASWSRSPT